MSESWRAGILQSHEIPEARIRASLEPDHRITAVRRVSIRRVDYLIEGPNMPEAAKVGESLVPKEIALLLTIHDLGAPEPEKRKEGGVMLTGRWEHLPEHQWTIRRWPDWDAFNDDRPF